MLADTVFCFGLPYGSSSSSRNRCVAPRLCDAVVTCIVVLDPPGSQDYRHCPDLCFKPSFPESRQPPKPIGGMKRVMRWYRSRLHCRMRSTGVPTIFDLLGCRYVLIP